MDTPQTKQGTPRKRATGTRAPRRPISEATRERMREAGRTTWANMHPDVRAARVAFLKGFWAKPERRSSFAGFLSGLWEEYEQEPLYRESLQALSEAMKRATREAHE